MKIAALSTSVLLFAFASCSTTSNSANVDTTYGKPNSIVTNEIEARVAEIPYQHRDELLDNLMWLAQTGEPAIPSLLKGLQNSEAKVRSSCAWVLGRIGDRRVIGELRNHTTDNTEAVRLEVCRTLVLLGDLQQAPTLIEGLDSDRREVRYMCHEALKTATGRDFGYDHLSLDVNGRRSATLSWRKWWSDYSGDSFFASSYAARHQINENAVPAAPMGETSTGSSNTGNSSTWNSHLETMEEGSGSTSTSTLGNEDPTSTTGSAKNSTKSSTPTTGNSSNGSATNSTTTNPSTNSTPSKGNPSNGSVTNSATNGSTTTNSTTTNPSTNSTPSTGNSSNGSATTPATTGSTNGSTSTNTGSNANSTSTGSGNGTTGTTGSGTNQTSRQG